MSGKTHIFSLHDDGVVSKLNLTTKESEDVELGKKGLIYSFKISPNKRWLALCQCIVKKAEKEGEKDQDYFELVVADLGEDKKKSDDDEEDSDEEYGSDSDSDYSGGSEESTKKIKEIRYEMKLGKEDLED